MTEAVIILRKSLDWFLYDNGLRHERVKSRDDTQIHFLKYYLSESSRSLGNFAMFLALINIFSPGSNGLQLMQMRI